MQKLNRILWAGSGAALLAFAGPAAADDHGGGMDSFTFESTSNELTQIGGDGSKDNPYMGAHWTGTSVGKLANGQETSSSFSCVSMTQPPNNSIFMMHMVCDITQESGSYSAVMGCQPLSDDAPNFSCIGGLRGKTGVFEGRRGSITNHAMGPKSSGTGQWFK